MNDQLQTAIPAAIAKVSEKYARLREEPIRPSTSMVLAALEKEDAPITSIALAAKHNWSYHAVSVILSHAFGKGLATRLPCPLPGRSKWEYKTLPKTTAWSQSTGGSAKAVHPGKSKFFFKMEKRFTLHIHGCSASFTLAELKELRNAINAAIKE